MQEWGQNETQDLERRIAQAKYRSMNWGAKPNVRQAYNIITDPSYYKTGVNFETNQPEMRRSEMYWDEIKHPVHETGHGLEFGNDLHKPHIIAVSHAGIPLTDPIEFIKYVMADPEIVALCETCSPNRGLPKPKKL